MKNPEWKQFEIAVAEFCSRVDPNATVTHDHYEPDRVHHGRRQRDVLIEGQLSQIPVRILISCKKYSRKLNSTDIEHFHGELISSGANKGCLFSYSGFSKPAILKAKSLGIEAYGLLANEANRFLDSLTFNHLVAVPKYQYRVEAKCQEAALRLQVDMNELRQFVLDSVADSNALAKSHGDLGTLDQRLFEIREYSTEVAKGIRFVLETYFYVYVCEQEAVICDGRYCFSTGKFLGTHSPPLVDLDSPPGEGWCLVESLSNCPPSLIRAILTHEPDRVARSCIEKITARV